MCGLAAILIQPNRSAEQLEKIRELFISNLIANEERGLAASGIAMMQNDGKYQVAKAPLVASEFARTSEFHQVMSGLSPETTILLGHTREPTKGSAADNNNNHPIIRGRIIGVHNGTIHNDDSLFSSHCQSQDRQGSVDSEAMFALLDQLPVESNYQQYANAVYTVSGLLDGSYTTLYFSPKFPSRLYLLKYKNQISAFYSPISGALIFSSRYLFLRKTFGRAAISAPLPARSGCIFEADRISELQQQPAFTFPLADPARTEHPATIANNRNKIDQFFNHPSQL